MEDNWNDLFPVYGIIVGETNIYKFARKKWKKVSKPSALCDWAILDYGSGVFITQWGDSDCISSIYLQAISERGEIINRLPYKWEDMLGIQFGDSPQIVYEKIVEKKLILLYKDIKTGIDGHHRWLLKTPNNEFLINIYCGHELKCFHEDAFDKIRISMGKCERCNSSDLEFTGHGFDSAISCMCNYCGRKWFV